MRRVLIVTYYWPPSAGSGVQRWLKLAKYLPDFGWQPVVFTPENPDFALKDETLLADVPPEAEILKRPIWEPYSLLRWLPGKKKDQPVNAGIVKEEKEKTLKEKFLTWVRGNFFIPDPRIFWVRPSEKFLLAYLKENPVEAVITTGPPHSMHLIGLRLKKRLGLPWIADFRDPWSNLDFLKHFSAGKRARKRNEKLEQEVVRKADRILGASPSMVKLIQDQPVGKYITVTNGYDESDFEDFRPRPGERFVLFHGGLLNRLRNPEVLWDALETKMRAEPDFAQRLEIRLSGIVDPDIVADLRQRFPDRFVFLGYLSHKEVLSQYEEADILVLLINNTFNAKVNIPGKIFEYFATGKTILALGAPDSDAVGLLQNYPCAHSFSYDSPVESVARALNQSFAERGKMKPDPSYNPTIHSRKNLSRKVSAILDEIGQGKQA